MTTKTSEFANLEDLIEEAQSEEEQPFEPVAAPQKTTAKSKLVPDKYEIEKLKQQDKMNDNEHRRQMQWMEFNSIFKLLGWCIFLAFLVYLAAFFKTDSLSSSFFELLKTIIIAVVGYLLGQKPKTGN